MMVYTILFGDGFSLQSKAQEREFNIGRAACPTVATPSRTFLDKAWTDKLSVLRFFETLRSYGSNLAASDSPASVAGISLGCSKPNAARSWGRSQVLHLEMMHFRPKIKERICQEIPF